MAGGADFVAYTTAKAAVIGLTNSLAREFGPDNIRVNAIAPGAVDDRTAAPPLVQPRHRPTRLADAPDHQARGCCRDEIARAALFLAADDSRMITKQCIIVDAGLR